MHFTHVTCLVAVAVKAVPWMSSFETRLQVNPLSPDNRLASYLLDDQLISLCLSSWKPSLRLWCIFAVLMIFWFCWRGNQAGRNGSKCCFLRLKGRVSNVAWFLTQTFYFFCSSPSSSCPTHEYCGVDLQIHSVKVINEEWLDDFEGLVDGCTGHFVDFTWLYLILVRCVHYSMYVFAWHVFS